VWSCNFNKKTKLRSIARFNKVTKLVVLYCCDKNYYDIRMPSENGIQDLLLVDIFF
jgi:hypothetical protein